MDKKDESTPSSLWGRRSNNTTNKLSLSTNKPDQDAPSIKRFGSLSGQSKTSTFGSSAPTSATVVGSPTTSDASSAFRLGSGAFASFGNTKSPKTPGSAFDLGNTGIERKEPLDGNTRDTKRPPAKKSQSSLRNVSSSLDPPPSLYQEHPLRYVWILYFRPPTSKDTDYEKSIIPKARIHTIEAFWKVYTRLLRPSKLQIVSDFHFFREGIRPVWEDEANRQGGKHTMRLKKGVVDRYWEDLLIALIGDQFIDASDDVCGAVVSVRSGEDLISVWTKNNGAKNGNVRESIKSLLSLPPDTDIKWRSHDDSIGPRNSGNNQRNPIDQARPGIQDKRRSTLNLNRDKKNEADTRS